MNDAGGVRLGQRASGLGDDAPNLDGGKRPAPDDCVREGFALEKLHDDVRQSLLTDAVVIDVNGMLRRQLGRGARLDLEPGARLRLLGESRPYELDGDAGPERRVRSLPYRAHSSGPDHSQYTVLARDDRALEVGHIGRGDRVAHGAIFGP